MKRIPGFRRQSLGAGKPGKRGRISFAGPPTHPLDLVKPPDYELDESWREQTKSDVGQLIDSLKPNALDAGTREVVHNFINARVLRSLKEIESLRAERLAIARVLVGMANEEVSRRHPGYEVDFARASHARTALADAYERLTGRPAAEFVAAAPPRAGDEPKHSTVGTIDLHLNDPTTWPVRKRDQRSLRDRDMDLPPDRDLPTDEDTEEENHDQ